jgi:origin recognition complex subunit 5
MTCETFNDFVQLFKQVTSAEHLKDQTVYIVSNLIWSYYL